MSVPLFSTAPREARVPTPRAAALEAEAIARRGVRTDPAGFTADCAALYLAVSSLRTVFTDPTTRRQLAWASVVWPWLPPGGPSPATIADSLRLVDLIVEAEKELTVAHAAAQAGPDPDAIAAEVARLHRSQLMGDPGLEGVSVHAFAVHRLRARLDEAGTRAQGVVDARHRELETLLRAAR